MSFSDVKSHTAEVNFDKYENHLFNKCVDCNPNLFWCLTPNCKYVFDNERKEITLCCPLCFKKYCL